MTEHPYGGPHSWVWASAAAVCDKIQDGTHFSPKEQLAAGPFPYVTAKNVKPCGLDLTDITYLPDDTHRSIFARCDPRYGDVLLVKDGVNAGDAALNSVRGEISLLSSVCFLRPKQDILDAGFLRYFLLSPGGSKQLLGKLSGTAIRRIILRRIRELQIPIPPLDLQRRIVSEVDKHFSRLDAAVAALKRAQANLKRYRAIVLEAAFRGTLCGDGRRTACIGQDVGPLPAGWRWGRMGDICADGPQNGVYYPQSRYGTGVPILRIDDFQIGFTRSRAELRQVANAEGDVERYGLRPNDLVINRVNSPSHLGKCFLVNGNLLPALFESNMMRLRLVSDVDGRFIQFYLQSPSGRGRLTANAKWAVNQASINQQDVLATDLPLPPFLEQRAIVDEIERHLTVTSETEKSIAATITHAESLRRSTLTSAFSGRLVPQDPDDEPASVLLERIRAERTTALNKKPNPRRKPALASV